MSTRRLAKGGYVDISKLPKGPNGRALCRQCSDEVPTNRRSFCSEKCVDDWKVRTDPEHQRTLVLKRDKGICALCSKDCVAAKNKHHKLKQELWSSTGADTTRIDAEMKALAREFGVLSFRRNWWDMDHTIPVIEGGGECGLENLRTLCILCHKKVTKELAARRAANRKTEKEQK